VLLNINLFFVKGFFYKFTGNILRCFWKRNILWHILAIGITYILVNSGIDWKYFEATRSTAPRSLLWPAVMAGAFIPLFGVLVFFIASLISKNQRFINMAYAFSQAAIVGLLTSDFYKFFTGRPAPPGFSNQDFTTDISRVFRFGLDRGGVFFGWPSSHTIIAFAMAVTFIILIAEKNKWLKLAAILYALYIGIGVSVTIHWFSDFVAGAIIGTVIGTVVGKSFRERLRSLF
jgi:membrane-associated phospholipid phosphatase